MNVHKISNKCTTFSELQIKESHIDSIYVQCPGGLHCVKMNFSLQGLLSKCEQTTDSNSNPWYWLIQHQNCYDIETSQLICSANYLTGFYMMTTFAFNELIRTATQNQFSKNSRKCTIPIGTLCRNHDVFALIIWNAIFLSILLRFIGSKNMEVQQYSKHLPIQF